jgi:hypothetical protein
VLERADHAQAVSTPAERGGDHAHLDIFSLEVPTLRGETCDEQQRTQLLESLNAGKVRYLIGGAHALAFHARPRATKDLGLFVAPPAQRHALH